MILHACCCSLQQLLAAVMMSGQDAHLLWSRRYGLLAAVMRKFLSYIPTVTIERSKNAMFVIVAK